MRTLLPPDPVAWLQMEVARTDSDASARGRARRAADPGPRAIPVRSRPPDRCASGQVGIDVFDGEAAAVFKELPEEKAVAAADQDEHP